MKKFTFILLCSTLFYLTGFSQTSCQPFVVIWGQSEIDNFPNDFPGCTVIEGSIMILGEETWNLNGLSAVTEIQGSLFINVIGSNEGYVTTNLTDLTGLNNLTAIGGFLTIGDPMQPNTPLASLEGLNNLTSVGFDLTINSSEALENFTGLSSLTTIVGSVTISDNNSLINMDGLNSLTSIGSLFIWNSESITNIEGLENLNNCGGVFIGFTPLLESLSGLENLTSIGGNMSLIETPLIASLNGLINLNSIGGDLVIQNASSLTSLSGLNNLNSIGRDLFISFSPSLTSLNGLINLTTIGRDLAISENPALLNLTGLNNVQAGSIDDLWISNNTLLSSCDVQSVCDHLADPNAFTSISGNAPGCIDNAEVEQACLISPSAIVITSQIEIDDFQLNFPGLTETEGDLVIKGNDIENLNGLNVLTSVGGDLWIGNHINGNPVLTDVSGLENLSAVGGGLFIVNNTMLTGLSGFNKAENVAITTIGGDLWIEQNQSLTDLSGLDNVTAIGGSLSIINNPALIALTGLDNIDAESITDLFIFQNNSLSLCGIASVCGLLAEPNGVVEIFGNASECESVEAVMEACVVGIEELIAESGFSIYPNPAKGELFISNNNGQFIKRVNIYNQLGQTVIQQNGITVSIDISKMQQGMYVVEIISGNSKYRKKLLVQ